VTPGTFAYAGSEAIAGGEGLVQKALSALALLAAVAFPPLSVRRLRGARTTHRAGSGS
jgi:hypothetical protein